MSAHSSYIRYLPRLILMSLFICVLWTGWVAADPPAGYYDSVVTSTPETLRVTLNAVIDGHTKIPYTSSSTDTWNVLELADQDPLDSGNILDVYRNRTYDKYGGGNSYYNREHSWPNSYGFPDDGSSNKPYTDCHHLFLCDTWHNGARANRVFNWCTTGCGTYTADNYNGQSGVNLTKDASPVGIWETWAGRRGDIARAQFYMDVRYEGNAGEPDLILTDDVNLIVASATGNNESIGYMGLLEVLLEWHEDDPVDDKERDRNDVVYSYQGNRNPFIDHPEWVNAIFVDGYTGVASEDLPPAVDTDMRITKIYPNPFNPRTNVDFSITNPGLVQLNIYSLDGRLVRTLLNETRESGEYQMFWDGTNGVGENAASGLYFCRLQCGNQVDTQKLVLLR